MKIIAVNKTAGFEYFIEDKYEAGIVLEGNEIKSVRAGAVNMNDSFCQINGSKAVVKNMHVALYDKSDAFSTKKHAARPHFAAPQKRACENRGKNQPSGVHAGAAENVLQRFAGKNGGGALQRQTHVR